MSTTYCIRYKIYNLMFLTYKSEYVKVSEDKYHRKEKNENVSYKYQITLDCYP